MKIKQPNLSLILPALAVFAQTAMSATVYNIDIGRSDQALLKSGYTALHQPNSTTGGSVTIDGDLFQLGGNISGSRNRGVSVPVGVDELTADFVFGGVGTITLTLGGAGGLQAGTWELTLYSSDFNVPTTCQDQVVGITTTTGINSSSVTYGAAVDMVNSGPAFKFQFTSNGTSAYTLFVSDSPEVGANFDGTRLNGIDLVLIPEPSTALLGAIGFLALLRRRR